MEILFLLVTGFTIGITGAMIPGPLTFFTVSATLRTNGFAGLKTVSGHIAVEFILIGLTALGLHGLFTSERFLSAASAVGGVALIAMGAILIANSGRMCLIDKEAGSKFSRGLFAGGFFFSAVSPGFLVWWATIGVSTLTRAFLYGVAGVSALVLGHWLADVLWYWFISYAVDRGKTYLNDGSYRNMVRVFSAALIAIGGYFLFG